VADLQSGGPQCVAAQAVGDKGREHPREAVEDQ
jgi:hypothetical protein